MKRPRASACSACGVGPSHNRRSLLTPGDIWITNPRARATGPQERLLPRYAEAQLAWPRTDSGSTGQHYEQQSGANTTPARRDRKVVVMSFSKSALQPTGKSLLIDVLIEHPKPTVPAVMSLSWTTVPKSVSS